jgi:predicted phosphodiesterase
MGKFVYTLTRPDGNVFEGVENLSDFCSAYDLNVKRVHDAIKNGHKHRGWSAEKYLKPQTSSGTVQNSSLTVEEKLIRLQDENSKLKQEAQEGKRSSSLFKDISEVIESVKPFDYIPKYKEPNKNSKIKESGVLILSDSHADQIIKAERTQGLEEFNFHVACKRAERIVDTTISHLTENMTNYSFKTLYILALGDFVSGAIHGAKEHSEWKNDIKNALATGELFAQMVLELSEKFENIVMVCLSGNHPRKSIKKDYRGSQDNFDFLVAQHVKTRLKNLIDCKKLTMIIPDAWSTIINIEGYNFVLSHGDDIRSFGSLPLFGIERKTRRLTSVNAVHGLVPNYFIFGHYHTQTALANITGEILINSAWTATDEYALESLGAFNEPSQTLFGVHEKYGKTWSLPIKLRTKNWRVEEQKPTRYKIDLFK